MKAGILSLLIALSSPTVNGALAAGDLPLRSFALDCPATDTYEARSIRWTESTGEWLEVYRGNFETWPLLGLDVHVAFAPDCRVHCDAKSVQADVKLRPLPGTTFDSYAVRLDFPARGPSVGADVRVEWTWSGVDNTCERSACYSPFRGGSVATCRLTAAE